MGDISLFSPRYPEKEKVEKRAIEEILGKFPEYKALWREYAEGVTPEAKVVKQADKLELLLQALRYEKQGHDVGDFWVEEYEFEGTAKRLYELLKGARP